MLRTHTAIEFLYLDLWMAISTNAVELEKAEERASINDKKNRAQQNTCIKMTLDYKYIIAMNTI